MRVLARSAVVSLLLLVALLHPAGISAVAPGQGRTVVDEPSPTFSLDVDTASYTNVRRFLSSGMLPPPDAVRIEELVNYFRFRYPDSQGPVPFGVTVEVGPCPWNTKHRLVLVGLQAEHMPDYKVPPRNLVFLLDVSTSMTQWDRLPLIRSAMRMLTGTLRPQDHVAIVVTAGGSGVVLPSTSGARKPRIEEAIETLTAGGSTDSAAGLDLAYAVAQANFVEDGINRVILATDGDVNGGVTSQGDLLRLVEDKRRSGVFLSVLGVGDDNREGSALQQLAEAGNGNYSYLDSVEDARRVLVEDAGATLLTVARDVKLQVEFNPATAGAYRLVGDEDRPLRNEDVRDERGGGDMGAGHTVTALYEIASPQGETALASELMTVKVRYNAPDGGASRELSYVVPNCDSASAANLGFAAAVAEFGLLLRASPYAAQASWADAIRLARLNKGEDPDGYRAEFIRLAELARDVERRSANGSR